MSIDAASASSLSASSLSASASSTSTKPTKRAKSSWLWRCLRFCFWLVVLHVATAAQLLPIIGFFAALYLVFPPILGFIAWDSIRIAPMFAVLALGPCLALLAPLLRLSRELSSRLPRPLVVLCWITAAIWLPVAAGETLRFCLMETRIAVAEPECHDTQSLLMSLRERNAFDFDHRPEPHAWMIDDGQIRLWSYKTLNFEPAPGWSDAGAAAARCHAGAIGMHSPEVGDPR